MPALVFLVTLRERGHCRTLAQVELENIQVPLGSKSLVGDRIDRAVMAFPNAGSKGLGNASLGQHGDLGVGRTGGIKVGRGPGAAGCSVWLGR